jgi:hypothetical protein
MDLHFQAFLSDERLVCRDVREESVMYRDHTGLQGEVVDFDELLSRTGPDAPVFIKGCTSPNPSAFPCGGGHRPEVRDQGLPGSHVPDFPGSDEQRRFQGQRPQVALNFRGLDCSQCVAFGDAENDGPMLEAAGLGVAMENASAALKKIADDIAPSNVQDGVAVYLERLLDLKR